MPSEFPAFITYGEGQHSRNEHFLPPADGATELHYGHLVIAAEGAETVARAASPAINVIGLSEVDSSKAKLLTPHGMIPIRLISTGAVIVFSSDTDPVIADHLNSEVGIVYDADTDNYKVDPAGTGWRVVRLDVPEGRWYCTPIAAALAPSGGLAS